jgi:multidrug efflux pump subunit AcrA (membrane-fusion protein)
MTLRSRLHGPCMPLLFASLSTTFSGNAMCQSASSPQAEGVSAAVSQPQVSVVGQLVLIEDWTIPAPQNGVLESVVIREGSMIEKDALIASLDSSLLALERNAAEAAWKSLAIESKNDVDLRFAKMTTQVRKNELQRGNSANQMHNRAVAAVEIERMELMLQQAKLSTEQAELKAQSAIAKEEEMLARLQIVEWRMDRASIRAKFRGIVVEVFAREGAWVQEGKPIARVIGLDRLRFESLIPIATANNLVVGAEGEFTASDTKLLKETVTAKGILIFVSPELNPVTKQVRIIAEIENDPQRLRPGLTGTMKF